MLEANPNPMTAMESEGYFHLARVTPTPPGLTKVTLSLSTMRETRFASRNGFFSSTSGLQEWARPSSKVG